MYTLFTLVIGLITLFLLRFLNRDWWQIKLVKYAAVSLPVLSIVALGLLIVSRSLNSAILTRFSTLLASACLVLIISSIAAFAVSGVIKIAYRIIRHLSGLRRHRSSDTAGTDRRAFLTRSLAVFPVLTTGAGLGGMVGSFLSPKVREIEFTYDNLPAQLDGFRILHLSDLHLGRYFKMADLDELIEDLGKKSLNLILISGDICDVPDQLPETLDKISALNPSHGCFASLGNHEYYHGVRRSIEAHARSRIPLLIDSGVSMDVDGTGLYVGGANDPVSMFTDVESFLSRSVAAALASARYDEFKIIMSHRPRGFVPAAERGVDLTLAGHTHGAQMGIGGRSLFESDDPPNYFWGEYAKGRSRLYTSAGVGHWFPFRLGCPAEAPIITLKKSA